MTKQSTTTPVNTTKAVDEISTAASKTADTSLATATKTAEDATQEASVAINVMTDRAVETARDVTAEIVSATEATQKSIGETVEKFSVRMHGMRAFGQQNFEAFSKASEISAKAFENFSSEVASYSKKAHEDRIAAIQDLTNAKSPTELVEKQMSFAQHTIDSWAQQAIRMSEIYTSATKEAAAPLGARVSALTEELQSTAR